MSGGTIHQAIQDTSVRWLKRQQDGPHRRSGCSVVITDLVSYAGEIPDVIGWNSDISILIECKASRADFLRDSKKLYRLVRGMGNRRYFAAPAGLLTPEEIPDGWGLLEMDGAGTISITKHAVEEPLQRDSLMQERRILVSALRRK